jgi:hypothetical protein
MTTFSQDGGYDCRDLAFTTARKWIDDHYRAEAIAFEISLQEEWNERV